MGNAPLPTAVLGSSPFFRGCGQQEAGSSSGPGALRARQPEKGSSGGLRGKGLSPSQSPGWGSHRS